MQLCRSAAWKILVCVLLLQAWHITPAQAQTLTLEQAQAQLTAQQAAVSAQETKTLAARQTMNQAQVDSNSANRARSSALSSYNRASTLLTTAENNLAKAKADGADDATIGALNKTVTEATAARDTAATTLQARTDDATAATQTLNTATTAFNQQTAALENATDLQEVYRQNVSSLGGTGNTDLTEQEQAVADQTAKTNTAREAMNQAQIENNRARRVLEDAQDNYTTADNALDTAQMNLAQAQADGADQATLDSLNDNVKQAIAARDAATAALQVQNDTVSNTAQTLHNTTVAFNQERAALDASNNQLRSNQRGNSYATNTGNRALIDLRNTAGNVFGRASSGVTNSINSAARYSAVGLSRADRMAFSSAYEMDVKSAGGSNDCTDGTLGGMICSLMARTTGGVGVITGIAFLAATLLGFQAVWKLKEHVESPSHVPLWDPMKRFVAAGAFFAFPFVVDVVRETIEAAGTDTTSSGFNGQSSGLGLDAMVVKLMANVTEPMIWAVGWFGWIAGLILVFIGISRLLKTEQEGPRGPTGIGTVMTFLVAGCLFSLNSIVAYATMSIFGTDNIATRGVLQYAGAVGGAADRAHAVISAIIAFSIIIGWISLVRGLFIIRGVSEGNSQASMMAAMTHLIGGALAINLGSVIMAVQKTLGITAYGITFS